MLFKNLCENLVKEGYEITILTQKTDKYSLHKENINGVKIERINTFNRYFFTFLSLPRLYSLAKDCDLIHTSTFASALPSYIISKLRKKKMILTVHEVWIGKWNQVSNNSKISNWINDKIERIIYFFNYKNYITVSCATSNALIDAGINKEQITTIYNGVDYDLWDKNKYDRSKRKIHKIKKTDHLFFFSGRPGRSKGLSVLISAFAKLAKENKNVKLFAIVSSKNTYKKEYDALIRQIYELNVNDRVYIHDPVKYKELPWYFMMADTVVVPSLSEGFGFVAAEAHALDLPIIATSNASLPEVVGGKHIFVSANSVDELYCAMLRSTTNDYDKSKKKIHTYEKNIKEHIKYYKKIMNS